MDETLVISADLYKYWHVDYQNGTIRIVCQHGMTDPQSPSVVVTLVINGNLPVPSSWSRRKTPTIDTP